MLQAQRKNLALLLVLSISTTAVFCQLKSPSEFLGYTLGTRYTPHYKIVNYFNYVATQAADRMKVEEYGETNEHRPLLLAYISSATNFSRLDDIRKNNLRLTGLLTDKPAELNAPVIVWLSYNVHGNETSSSEAAMKTLFELVNPSNARSAEWLKNVVVIIDPCLNPDGRDRYVNWFTQMVGKDANPDPNAREHSEPWPGGRVNHYNFDLNRDWAWQTQVETQQRMKKYNEWLPQIHCDFHEQGINNPYYFAPAAEPFHEVITQWQRDFQNTIGRNHAKYFDKNGWLYFTRYQFDLFYPAYGDTYPLYNGAIGMTYEQAGGPRGGTTITKGDGDSLTLADRIEHHFTTGMSTVEVCAINADRVIKEYKKFFDDAGKNGSGDIKTYVVTSNSFDKLKALTDLLDRNLIKYGGYTKSAAKGYNYFTGKEELINTGSFSIGISTVQPKSALVKVLFEPKSKLVDSATYDITAWSLPYAYGLQAYSSKEILPLGKLSPEPGPVAVNADYGYLVNYTSFNDSKLLAQLLKRGVRLRFAETDFTYNKKIFNKGTLIILKKENDKNIPVIMELLNKFKPDYSAVETGFMDNPVDFGSEKIHFIHKPKVAMFTGSDIGPNSAGEVWHYFEQQLDYPITLINTDEMSRVSWKNIDVLIMPDGYYKFLADKDASAQLRSWVRQGGKIIALESAVSQMAGNDWGIKLKKSDDEKKDDKKDNKTLYDDLHKYENRERDALTGSIPGAIYKVELDDTHPLAFGLNGTYFTLKLDDNIYEFMKDAWNVGVIKKDNQVAGFAGVKVKEKLKDGTVMAVQDMGRGSLVYLAEDPIFRSFWENGKVLLSNAVFLVGE